MSVKLTDAQLVMMSAAAQRKDRCLSAPATIKGAALSKVGAKLAKLGLAREIEAKPGAPMWRRDDAGQGYALKLTAAGLKAIAVDEGLQDTIEPSEASQPQSKNVARSDAGGEPPRGAAPRDGSKLALVIEHLQADIRGLIDRVTVSRTAIQVQLSEAAEAEAGTRTLTFPWALPSPYRKREIIQGDANTSARPMRANARAVLIDACPSSDDLGHFVSVRNGGSGSSCFDVMPRAAGAASGGLRLSGV
jgi:hypothetical protein